MGKPCLKRLASFRESEPAPSKTKKADLAEHPEVFQQVGFLVNEPTGTASLIFIYSSGEIDQFSANRNFKAVTCARRQ